MTNHKKIENLQTVIVTGASGFLGKEVVKHLLEQENIYVIALTTRKKQLIDKVGKSEQLKVLHTHKWQQKLDINQQIDVLINCAFPRTSDPKALAKGIQYTESLISDTVARNLKGFINISSQSVYSQEIDGIVDEYSIVKPETLYGMTKFACERIVAIKCEQSGINYSNIRLGSLVGIELDVRITNRFVKATLEGNPITVNGGEQKISYLHVKDAAKALVKMAIADSNKWKDTYNLGNDEYYTVLELAETVKEIATKYTRKDIIVNFNKGKSTFNNLLNSELFYDSFEWKPKMLLYDLLKELFNHYKKDKWRF